MKTTYLESRPQFAYSLFNFCMATMTIKGGLLVSIPIVKRSSAEKNIQVPPKSVPKWRFFAKMGVCNLIFIFKTPKRHILAWDRVFWRILREDQFWGLGCSLFEEPKKNEIIAELYFTHMGRKKP